ncbi:hypothetical protein G9A89_010569 [Geosiphon pyriformis]|nr:hypothetical protein G9A89_010569 [Geosiphon pyriformis]
MSDLIWRVAMCNVRGIHIPAKQEDVVCWHFDSGLDVGFLGASAAIIIDNFLARHVSKVEEVLGYFISVWLFFKDKLSVLVLGLYAGASAGTRFGQASEINSFIVKAVNSSTFVVLGGNFNEDGSRKNVIDFIFVSEDLSAAIAGHGIASVQGFFDTNHKTVSVSICLGGLLNAHLNSVRKQANKNRWKFRIRDAGANKWLGEFYKAKTSGNLNAMWEIIREVVTSSTDKVFSRFWFSEFECSRNKQSSKFFKLELLVAKLMWNLGSYQVSNVIKLIDAWFKIDVSDAVEIHVMVDNGANIEVILCHLSEVRKKYHKSKYFESRIARDIFIRKAIDKCMENFCSNKGRIIKSVLERPFWKVVFDHLIIENDLILESGEVKSAIDGIMEDWTRKHVVPDSLPPCWLAQYVPLVYVDDCVFSAVMCDISSDEFLKVVYDLPDGKSAGLSGIPNKLWKHSDLLILGGLLDILNTCLKLAWVSMIPKPYNWKGTLTNTQPIVLIETVRKILSKILSNRIFLACSRFNVLCGNNFSVLKGTSTQTPIFAIGSIIEDALEKNRELWLVLQDMCKAYDSVGWFHFKASLARIKMCSCFIKFFGDIHNNQTNQVMTDFGLTNGYTRIFYDSLLCEIKRHEQLYGYRLSSKFFTKTGKMDARGNLTSYFAAGAFVDDTIWIGNCLFTTQKILDIASKFFLVNNISINASKMVAIPINQGVKDVLLSISGSNILVVKRRESHQYLGIFISSDGLSKLSLAKAHLDVRFFSNVVLRKAITKKQFLYLVSAVLQPIVSYRLQFSCVSKSVCDRWDVMLKKDLKLKANLPKDFPSDALHHPELFGLRTFEQVLTENLLASLISFANASGILGRLFDHRAMDLQAASWMSRHPLWFPIRLMIDPIDCFLSGVTCALVLCNLSLDGDMFDVFQTGSGVTVLDMLRLDPRGLVSAWFTALVNFVSAGGLSGGGFVPFCPTLAGVPCDFSYVHNQLLASGLDPVTIYMDGSVKYMGSVDAHRGTAAYFSGTDISIGVSINGLLSLTLVELQAITLALKCMSGSSSVVLFMNSQASLNMCCSGSGGFGPDFWDKCWIEKEYIGQIISRKGLSRANFYANSTVTSSFILTSVVPFHFLRVEKRPVSGNAHQFVKTLFNVINFVGWEARCASVFVDAILYGGFDRARTFNVWHSDGKIGSDFTSSTSMSLRLYFMKYPSIAYIRCGLLENSDHTFSCLSDNNARKELLSTAALDWADSLDVCTDNSVVFHFLEMAAVSTKLYMALAKGFVLKSWVDDVCCWLGANFDGGALVVRFLRAYYEKHNLLPYDGSSISLVSGLFSLWSSDIIHGFSVKLGVHVSFELYPCLSSLDFGFLNGIPVVGCVGI